MSCGGKGATDITGGTFVSKCGAPIMIIDMKQTGHVSIKKAVLRTKPGYERGAMWVPKKNNENIYISKENILFYGTSRHLFVNNYKWNSKILENSTVKILKKINI